MPIGVWTPRRFTPEKNAKARTGGLEVAVRAALKQKSGIWFGWSGKVATHTKIAKQRVVHDKIRIRQECAFDKYSVRMTLCQEETVEDILGRAKSLGIKFDRKLDRPFKLQQLLYDACYQRACMEEQFLDTLIQGMMIEKIEEEIDAELRKIRWPKLSSNVAA